MGSIASKKASAPGGSTTGSGSATNTGEAPSETTTAGITSMDSSGSTWESTLLLSSSGAMVWGSDQVGAVQTVGSGVSSTAGWTDRLAASAASMAVTSTCRDGSSSLNRSRISCRDSPGNASGVKVSGTGTSLLV